MEKLGTSAQIRMVGAFLWGRIARQTVGSPELLRKVRAIVKLAYDHTEFYRWKLAGAGLTPGDIHTWQDVDNIPLTTKEELLAAGSAAHVSRRIRSAFLSRSSGSSGTYIDIYGSTNNWIKDGLIGIDAYREYVNLRCPDRLLYANTSSYPFTSVGGVAYRVAYFDNLRPIGELVDFVVKRRPQVLMVYPSIAADLMRLWQPEDIPPLKAVITHSEQSSQLFRDEVGRHFGCPVYDEYATEELGRVALQCRFGAYHLIEHQSYCEIVDPHLQRPTTEGGVGEIVGTSLINDAMPFIRYRQNDLASISTRTCRCGHSGRILGDLLGRRNDSFRLPNGEILASGRLLDWTYHLILRGKIDIVQFELVQLHLNGVRFAIVPGPCYDSQVDDVVIKSSFQELLTDAVRVEITQVASIPPTSAGKRILIRSELARAEPGHGSPTPTGYVQVPASSVKATTSGRSSCGTG